jgi:hypothetical protein
MAGNYGSFSRSVENFADCFDLEIEDAVDALVMQLTEDIILSTPVDEGTARANWNASLGYPDKSHDLNLNDETGISTVNDAAAIVKAFSNGEDGTYYLTNSLPYIEYLENGSSSKNPKGMLKVNVDNFTRNLKYGKHNRKYCK